MRLLRWLFPRWYCRLVIRRAVKERAKLNGRTYEEELMQILALGVQQASWTRENELLSLGLKGESGK